MTGKSHLSVNSTWVDHISIVWIEPKRISAGTRLVIWLNGFSGTKEQMIPYLQDLADAGFTALSFDAWQHGEGGTETPQALGARVFSNFRRYMWPILGQTVLDTLRVIDWAIASLGVQPEVYMGGISMGGDIAVAAAGADDRISRVATMVATPDWLRPGMQDVFQPGTLVDPGMPDAYAQYFYDRFNPLTHLEAYLHAPAIAFECAAKDTHVPADGALRFQSALRAVAPQAAEQVRVNLIPNAGHLDTRQPAFWGNCLAWFKG